MGARPDPTQMRRNARNPRIWIPECGAWRCPNKRSNEFPPLSGTMAGPIPIYNMTAAPISLTAAWRVVQTDRFGLGVRVESRHLPLPPCRPHFRSHVYASTAGAGLGAGLAPATVVPPWSVRQVTPGGTFEPGAGSALEVGVGDDVLTVVPLPWTAVPRGSKPVGTAVGPAGRLMAGLQVDGRGIVAVFGSSGMSASTYAAALAAAGKAGAVWPLPTYAQINAQSELPASTPLPVLKVGGGASAGGAPGETVDMDITTDARYTDPLVRVATHTGIPAQVQIEEQSTRAGLGSLIAWTPAPMPLPEELAGTPALRRMQPISATDAPLFTVHPVPPGAQAVFVTAPNTVYVSVWPTPQAATTFASCATTAAAAGHLALPTSGAAVTLPVQLLSAAAASTQSPTMLTMTIPAAASVCPPRPTSRPVCPTGAGPGQCTLTLPRGGGRSSAAAYTLPPLARPTLVVTARGQTWTLPDARLPLPAAPPAVAQVRALPPRRSLFCKHRRLRLPPQPRVSTPVPALAPKTPSAAAAGMSIQTSADGTAVLFATQRQALVAVFDTPADAKAYTQTMQAAGAPGGFLPVRPAPSPSPVPPPSPAPGPGSSGSKCSAGIPLPSAVWIPAAAAAGVLGAVAIGLSIAAIQRQSRTLAESR